MIDVHAPHGGMHTWKDFWIHLGTITLRAADRDQPGAECGVTAPSGPAAPVGGGSAPGRGEGPFGGAGRPTDVRCAADVAAWIA